MARSLENLPEVAIFRTAFRVHASGADYN